MNVLSPTETMWSRPSMPKAAAFGISFASACGEPAISSRVPTAISVGGGGSFHVPAFVGETMMTMLGYGVFITVGAYGLLYYIVRRVNERL